MFTTREECSFLEYLHVKSLISRLFSSHSTQKSWPGDGLDKKIMERKLHAAVTGKSSSVIREDW